MSLETKAKTLRELKDRANVVIKTLTWGKSPYNPFGTPLTQEELSKLSNESYEKWVRLEDVQQEIETWKLIEKQSNDALVKTTNERTALEARLERIKRIINSIPYPARAYGDELADWFKRLRKEVDAP